MSRILTDLGEEYLIKNSVSGITFTVGLYNDSTDSISETDDLSAITTEPSGGAYARQSDTFTAADLSGDWGTDNDSQLSYDTSDSSQTVDSYFIMVSFQASDTGDSGANDHLLLTGALSQSRDLSQIDTLNISAGGVGFKVS
jgi:hypothetical protein